MRTFNFCKNGRDLLECEKILMEERYALSLAISFFNKSLRWYKGLFNWIEKGLRVDSRRLMADGYKVTKLVCSIFNLYY